MHNNILVVEDNKLMNELVCTTLKSESFEVTSTFYGSDALYVFSKNSYDLIILDIMLPDVMGEFVIRTIRKSSNVPIIIISAKNRDMDKVEYLKIGADDYLVKPFSMNELVARVYATIRRSKMLPQVNDGIWNIGSMIFDYRNHVIEKNQKKIALTKKEANILNVLLMHQGRAVSKENLFEMVWKKPFDQDDNLISVNIHRIRIKIEDHPEEPQWLISVRGYGFMIQNEVKMM
jgi:two-component system, OmpR family, response regulator VicR